MWFIELSRLHMWHSGKESTCRCRSHQEGGFIPWARKIPWSRKPTHSSILTCKILWTEEPGRRLFARSWHDWACTLTNIIDININVKVINFFRNNHPKGLLTFTGQRFLRKCIKYSTLKNKNKLYIINIKNLNVVLKKFH